MTRTSATREYDALVGLEPQEPGQSPGFAFALVKRTYELTPSGLVPAESEPLQGELESEDGLSPRLPAGSDYWLTKRATDVVIWGSAFAPEGRPVTEHEVSVSVASRSKRIAVFGRREIGVRAGHIVIAEPEPFSEMPVRYTHAYGGLDPRVPIPEQEREEYLRYAELGAGVDHPGLYPRNPIGKGYLVYPEPLHGLEMPNLEDPGDRLTVERLVVGAPELWYRQPLPWSFEWTNWLMYPRELYLGLDAWFPCAEPQQLPEVQRGLLQAAAAGSSQAREPFALEAYQEASLGLVFPAPLAGAAVHVAGMMPDRPRSSFTVPMAPAIEIQIEGQREACAPRLTQLVIRPTEKRVCAVWCAQTSGLPRVFVPGVHRVIPLQVRVDGGAPIRYVTPPTVRDRLGAAPRSASR